MANKLEQSTSPVRNFSFYADTGLIEGIVLQTNVPNPSKNGKVYPPHVRCGEQYIDIDRVVGPHKHMVDDVMMIFDANVREISPLNNNSSFKTLAGNAQSSAMLLYVATTPVFNPRLKLKYNPEAWNGVLLDGKVVSIIGDVRAGSALLQFTAEGQFAHIFLRDGSVFEVVLHNRTLQARALPPDEAATARVAQFESQTVWLTDSDADMRRLHGIIGGAIRLLRMTRKNPDARKVLTNFLRAYVDGGGMLYAMQLEVRKLLLDWNDADASFFYHGESNLVDLTATKKSSGKSSAAIAQAKKAVRSVRDRETREKMRGGSSGGNNNKKKQQNGK